MTMTLLHKALVLYCLVAMNAFIPAQRWQIPEYREIATAIVDATEDPEDEVQLASLASFESRFSVKAIGKLGEVGPFQLLGHARGDLRGHRGGGTLAQQAAEALRRWKTGMCVYTGETLAAPDCPLASHRYGTAVAYSYAHPFVAPLAPVAAR